MRFRLVGPAALGAALCTGSIAAACASGDPTGPAASLSITRAADLTGIVSKSTYESANGPAGPYAQYDVWLTVAPATAPNVGIIVPRSAPVFVSRGGLYYATTPADIRAGDIVRVWHDDFAGYGAVQAPPGAPVYTGTQVVIIR